MQPATLLKAIEALEKVQKPFPRISYDEALKQIANVLKEFSDRRFQVEGHTDNVPMKSARFPSNWELSTARASAVARFFDKEGGISPQRLTACGYSYYRPVAPNDTPEGRSQNRRIEIILEPVE